MKGADIAGVPVASDPSDGAIPPSTASAVVEETSGMSASISDLDMGIGVLSTILLILSISPSFDLSSAMSLRSRFL